MNALRPNTIIFLTGVASCSVGAGLAYELGATDTSKRQERRGEQQAHCAPYLGKEAAYTTVPTECYEAIFGEYAEEMRRKSPVRDELPSADSMRHQSRTNLHLAHAQEGEAASTGMKIALLAWLYALAGTRAFSNPKTAKRKQ